MQQTTELQLHVFQQELRAAEAGERETLPLLYWVGLTVLWAERREETAKVNQTRWEEAGQCTA